MYVACTVWTVARTNQGTAVLLKEEISGKSLPLFVNTAEAQVLLNNLNGSGNGSISLHAYTGLLFARGGITLKRVEIRRDSKGQPRACVRAGLIGEDDFTEELSLCDALALVAKNGRAVYVEGQWFAEKSVILNLVELEKKAKKKKLEDKLNRLVEKEEYEKAAVVRDRLMELDLENSDSIN